MATRHKVADKEPIRHSSVRGVRERFSGLDQHRPWTLRLESCCAISHPALHVFANCLEIHDAFHEVPQCQQTIELEPEMRHNVPTRPKREEVTSDVVRQ